MSDEENPNVKDILEKLMKGDGESEPFIMVGGEDGPGLAAPELQEPQEPPEMLDEGQEVTISGTLETGEELTINGVICGVAPIMTPFGPAGFDYVIRVLNPETLPVKDGKPYPYSCITAPPHLITKSGEESSTDEADKG